MPPDQPIDFDHVGFAGTWHLLFFGVLIPFVVVRSKRKLDDAKKLPPRKQIFARVIVQLAWFTLVSIFVAHEE